jgi:hypothetical protein
MRPNILHVGGTLFWVIRTRDPDTQVLKDADSAPTVAIRKNGASTGDSVTVTKRSATTGIYDCSYNPAGEVEGDEFTVEESATVTGTTTAQATYANSWAFTVLAVERGTDNAAQAVWEYVITGTTSAATALVALITRITAVISTKAEDDTRQAATIAAIEAIEGGGGSGGTNGTGAHKITVTVQRSTDSVKIRNVRVDIVGTDTHDYTDTNGVAVLNVGPNATYTLRITHPSGYTAYDDFTQPVVTTDVARTVSLVPLTIEPAVGANQCNVAIDVIDQLGSPFNGVSVSATVGTAVTGADEAGILDRDAKSQLTVDGRAVLTLIQGVTYTIRFEKGHQSKSFSYTVPSASSALATEDF